MTALRSKFYKAIQEREKQLKDYEEFLDEEVNDITLTKIHFTQLPTKIEPSVLEVFIENNMIDDNQK